MSQSIQTMPEEQKDALHRARWLEVLWIIALASIVTAIYFAVGSSQAMKTAWIEDLLSFVPPLAFLIGSWIEGWKPNQRFPLGYIRVTSIAYLISAVSLAGVGLFLIVDSSIALFKQEHPTIGSVEMFGVTFWFGWVMIAALAYSVVLPVIFGRLKMKPAKTLHDKTLYADALMNKADWMTGVAGIVGILGIGMGWWWADATAAIIIALDVLHDGYKHTGAAIRDLSDEMPRTIDDKDFDPLIDEVQETFDAFPWVRDSRLRLREEGRFLTGTIYAELNETADLPEKLEEAEAQLLDLHWRIHDISIMPRVQIDDTYAINEDDSGPMPLRSGAMRRGTG
ncbi:cation transporter [Gymnodinialimonas ceratoperidinii]|uniref:Cation transporter n=1 Tax=Gymnodinialimonas ceratoperidinii TaxID=2856823 RepID=A0A8F6YD60_9RHOB|nr:cation transporter [Gymnodinialimonas ceratoperidinii]QXT39862.1 cation transporter [Gymnodinialimonas ceratoperidinii]